MSKSILIIDTPEKCGNCRLCYKDNFDEDSWFTYRCTESDDKVDYDGIYENCPLKSLPEKKVPVFDPNDCDIEEEIKIIHEIEGYNRCIDEILGKENETDI